MSEQQLALNGGEPLFELSELEQKHPYRSWFVMACLIVLLILGSERVALGFEAPCLDCLCLCPRLGFQQLV